MMKRALFLLVISSAMLTGCGGRDSSTLLTVRVSNGVGEDSYELRCDPPGGTAPQPEQLCAALAENSKSLLFPPQRVECIGGFYTSHIYIAGEYQGKRVEATDLCGRPSARRLYEILPPAPRPLAVAQSTS